MKTNTFFQPFSQEAIEHLVSSAVVCKHPDNTLIFGDGDAADGVYLVLSGAAEMIKTADNGKVIPLSRVEPGDYFGEVGVIDKSGRSTGARTAGETELALIPAEPLMDTLRREHPDVSLHFCRRISAYLRITDSRFIEEVLRKERTQLVGEMARSIIHDFKNPMTSIQLASDLIVQINDTSQINECCTLITSQVRRMVAMAEELLDYSRGKPQLNIMKVRTDQLFHEIEFLNADYLRSSNVSFSFEPSNAILNVDKDRVVRALQNLISNATEAMESEGGTLCVSASECSDGKAVITVTDNGNGIPEEIRDKLFEPFVTCDKKKGTGLGTAVVKTVIEAHGGTINFETETGKGTTFIITLPCASD